MTDAELAEAKRYGRLDLACGLADKTIDVAYLAAAAFLLARPLDAWLQSYPLLAGNWSLRLAVFFLLITAIHLLVSFPLSFYSGHVLEHQFQLSTQTFRRWLWQYLKRNLLAIAFMLVLVEGLYWLIRIAGGGVVAAGGRTVLRGDDPARSALAGGRLAALLSHRKARRPGHHGSSGRARPGHRTVDRRRLSSGS